jgi:hypothetical protein
MDTSTSPEAYLAASGPNANQFVLRTAQLVADAVPEQEQSRDAVIHCRKQLELSRGES